MASNIIKRIEQVKERIQALTDAINKAKGSKEVLIKTLKQYGVTNLSEGRKKVEDLKSRISEIEKELQVLLEEAELIANSAKDLLR